MKYAYAYKQLHVNYFEILKRQARQATLFAPDFFKFVHKARKNRFLSLFLLCTNFINLCAS